MRDEQGNIVVEGGQAEFVEWPPATAKGDPNFYNEDQIIWEPATAEINGEELALDGRFLSRTIVNPNPNTVQAPSIRFSSCSRRRATARKSSRA